jgi:metallo-beta-lactamase family protein
MAEWRSLQFVGGTDTVARSKYAVSIGGQRILLDCGFFQGSEELHLESREALPFDAGALDAVVLSNAHPHHSGYLPLLVRAGFHGPIFCTPGTRALLGVFLLEAARVQAEDADFVNRHGLGRHGPALPFYTAADVEAVLQLTRPQPYDKPFAVAHGVVGVLQRAAHILGSATIEMRLGDQEGVCLVYSGDLGRFGQRTLRDPDPVVMADVLVVEATYGDHLHPRDSSETLARIVCETAERGGAVIVPTFAIGRAQELIWTLRELEETRRIPSLPVFVDAPMAMDATDLYRDHPEDHDLHAGQLLHGAASRLCCTQHHLVRPIADSKALNHHRGPMIVLAGNDMATGGRVLHHLKLRLPDERTTVLLPGFQGMGTLGRTLHDGVQEVRIHGDTVPVRAKITTLDAFSGHADRDEILRWLGGFRHAPRTVHVVHGEPAAATALAATIRAQLGWHATVAHDGETVGVEQ